MYFFIDGKNSPQLDKLQKFQIRLRCIRLYWTLFSNKRSHETQYSRLDSAVALFKIWSMSGRNVVDNFDRVELSFDRNSIEDGKIIVGHIKSLDLREPNLSRRLRFRH